MRLAVFVDGENIAADHAAAIWAIASGLARPTLSRVYGDASKLSKWEDVPDFALIHAGTGKNATDLLLCIDAMEYSLTTGFDAIIIASSDRDFSHLALRLREKGLRVIGVGEEKTSAKFRAACSVFHSLAPKSLAAPATAPTKPPQAALALVPKAVLPPKTKLDDKIRDVIAEASKGGGGMELSRLNAAMHAQHQFTISTTEEKSWRGYLSARPNLYAVDPKGPAAKVRFLAKAFAAAVATA